MSREPAALWDVGQVYLLAVSNLLGVFIVIGAWYGISGTTDLSTQLMWLTVSIGALVLAGLGNVAWMLSGFRAVGERRARLVQTFEGLAVARELDPPVGDADGAATAGAVRTPAFAADAADDTLVAGPEMTRYHRASCLLVHGKPVSAATRREHEAAARRPCDMCGP